MLDHGSDDFYNPVCRQKFLNEIIDAPNADVLPRFVELLESQVWA